MVVLRRCTSLQTALQLLLPLSLCAVGVPDGDTMNLEKLSKPELLTLLSILEGELEARDLVIEAIKAKHKDRFIAERYGKYNISDPLLALQRDYETLKEENHGQKPPVCSNPLYILKEVMKQCKTMQERMLAQLATAESRHRKVILDLEEERRRHAQDAADGDDVTYMLEKERERLAQQLEFEKSQVKKLEKEQKRLSSQLEEEKARHKQLSSVLMKECTKANNRAVEEGQRVEDVNLKLEKVRNKVSQLEEELSLEKKRGLQMEAQVEKQLSEFDIEREQLKAKLNREENRTTTLKEELESLKKSLKELKTTNQVPVPSSKEISELVSIGVSTEKADFVSVSCQTEPFQNEKCHTDVSAKSNIPFLAPSKIPQPYSKINGHCNTSTQNNEPILKLNVGDNQKEKCNASDSLSDNGNSPVRVESPLHMTGHLSSSGASSSPISTAASSLTSSPCSSPVLSRRLIGATANSPGYQSSYQVGINQRFHAARHKFQSQAEQDQHVTGLQSPPSRDLSPTLADNSAAKQLARNTVTQVLSRFTSQQTSSKPVPPNSSPFGTDYRTLANAASNQKSDGSHSPNPLKVSSPLSPVSPGIKSPTISRVERGNPPPIPPKKPGLAQSPASPIPPSKATNQSSALAASVEVSDTYYSNNGVFTNGKEIEIMLPSDS
ncbi:CTTNBP2 N-terminal-like protein isoform X1 [Xenopus laevis]|uniref:CTTNBP2 N-terminal-like protein isoform X1 n=1 Tax=Xenopus laevis TaxID=8355 RepID=A0A8J0UEU6_XENLA|nr:CTTNBP2 N-terminal-like protein isoform X1 [Xenopus laevis]